MLEDYLSEFASLEKKGEQNKRGEYLFADPVTVACRRQETKKVFLNSLGQKVVSEAVYFLLDEVSEGDRLDGHVVAARKDIKGLDAVVIGYKAVI